MPALAPAMLHAAAGAVPGRIFTLDAPLLPWLAPACILAGIALQLGALALCHVCGGRPTLRQGLLCAAGALLVIAGAALDRDVSVAVGEALALSGIWFAWRNG